MDIRCLMHLIFVSFWCKITYGTDVNRHKRPGSLLIRETHKRHDAIGQKDCFWDETDVCTRARPLFIDPDVYDGSYATLYSPQGICSNGIGKCARMRVPHGKQIIAACSGKNSKLIHRGSTFAVSTCLDGKFVDSQVKVNSPITQDSCTKNQMAELTFNNHANSWLKPFVLSFLIRERNTEYNVKIFDGVIDGNWNSILTRASISPAAFDVGCSERKGDFVTYSTFPKDIANSYGDRNWFKSIMKSTCRTSERELDCIDQKYVLKKMYQTDNLAENSNHKLVKGHLTANRDFSFRYQQDATFTFFNVAPQWQSVNDGVWKKSVEIPVRKAAKDAGETFRELTGTLGTLSIPINCGQDQNNNDLAKAPITTFGGNYRVPKLFWKLFHISKESIEQSTVLIVFNTINYGHLVHDKAYENLKTKCILENDGVFKCNYEQFTQIYNSNVEVGCTFQGLISLVASL